MRLLLATTSAGKIREIRAASAALGAGGSALEWVGLDEFPGIAEAVEDGASFAENARRKALHYAALTGLATLADDSGLEVDALGGEPGVDSAHFAGQPRNDAANNRKLVAALHDVPEARRTARFRCVMVLARGGRALAETSGAVEGRIVEEPRGRNGFGYDPHFLIPERGVTLAELSMEEKNAISHRGRALRAMLTRINHGVHGGHGENSGV